MDEKQLLDAIGKLMDDKIGVLREEVAGQINTVREEMNEQNRQTRVVVENGYKRIENLLREDYGRVSEAAAKGAAAADSQKDIASTVADHTRALENHNERIAELEKQAI